MLDCFMSETRQCRKCKQDKPNSDFRRQAKGPGGLAWWCRDCTVLGQQGQPSYQYLKSRWYSIKHQYNLTEDQYYEILDRQDGKCGLCGTDSPGRKNARDNEENTFFLIDHDHTCCPKRSCGSCVRGLLCFKCNVMLSMAQDNPDTLKAAIKYLEKPS